MLQDIMNQTFFQNSVEKYLISLSVFVLTLIVVKLFESAVLSRLKTWAGNTTSKIDVMLLNNLEKTLLPAMYYGSFYLAIRSLTLNYVLSRAIDVIGIIILTISGIRFLVAAVDYALEHVLRTKDNTDKERNLKAIMPILKVMIWAIGLIFLLDNLGFQISAVVAGLGIGGIAVALAAQALLRDLFSYVAIVFDRPFELGDSITIGEHAGTIEHIGIKTTHIRSLGGEQLVFSNSDLTNSRIQNYKRMTNRRVIFRFRVIYNTTSQQLKEIPEIVEHIIENIEDTTFDRAHFISFGDYSLDFEVVYYVVGNDYKKYMNIQQAINLALKEEFEQRSIEFAYITKTLFLQKQ
ncbi:mechanosensitive ion channel family protein [Sporomusa sp.]|uniref:mechanosensitive ion channel family protein n=1 Tax=Sporomusa sp. TaxID=2078658 RepID=UPI002C905B1F|nr:mechanosensitive ion channel family protein [Sporomusa sp.]HWR43397.1 mechanosensitive ion channel family protein [Sporomusa sp.]